MESVSTEIGLLEKTLHEIIRRPSLIRRGYWAAHVECLLARPGLRAREKERLAVLLDLLGAAAPPRDRAEDLQAAALTGD
jgi:hypothetical protein